MIQIFLKISSIIYRISVIWISARVTGISINWLDSGANSTTRLNWTGCEPSISSNSHTTNRLRRKCWEREIIFLFTFAFISTWTTTFYWRKNHTCTCNLSRLVKVEEHRHSTARYIMRTTVSQSASGLCGVSCPTASTTLSWHFSGLAYNRHRFGPPLAAVRLWLTRAHWGRWLASV